MLKQYEYQVRVSEIKKEIFQLVKDIRQYITNDQKIIELAKKLDELYNIVDKLEVPPTLIKKSEEDIVFNKVRSTKQFK